MTRPVPIVVVGPTASGKSDVALDVAERFDGEIVNADAMQQYRGMDIGTAKLPSSQRRGIVHHQLDVLDVTQTATVARYQRAAIADVEAIMARGRTPVVVGGSMMYFQALVDEWALPPTDPAVRGRYEDQLARIGTAEMHRRLAEVDPVAAGAILDTDGRRIVRALEVVELTGRPFAASQPQIGDPRWGAVIVGVDRDTEALDRRIAARTDDMFDAGFVDEVEGLLATGLRDGQTAIRAIGYAQVVAHLDGEYDVDRARELTFIGTRRYVRRQRSWFRRDPRIRWFDGGDAGLADAVAAHYRDRAPG
ncbi:tRNA dimethylallyltransferase [Gordonia araii NBRC 100433]|uniref:tRNA dimethylallyltransferase n=1 Tax=Gordonia araii NBRC 100433 TaxID=1073574 RepID=G7H0F4_9ACTN|nr:tRNA (adenosine(37)-N6)-dimethylallyltransferase MiaA [Gordonia araii]NNG96907.1 tRNA (adenosine(37)-N6)-dimethylallyltransferase MiaA [Gordonia araii NBRC 100433]GAB09329.1 tRNA dimethylallyltransferase [Gordonia araii NBRC 100433]